MLPISVISFARDTPYKNLDNIEHFPHAGEQSQAQYNEWKALPKMQGERPAHSASLSSGARSAYLITTDQGAV